MAFDFGSLVGGGIPGLGPINPQQVPQAQMPKGLPQGGALPMQVDPTLKMLGGATGFGGGIQRTMGGQIADQFAPEGLDWLTQDNHTGGHSWEQGPQLRSGFDMNALNAEHAQPTPQGMNMANQYGHGSMHQMQPGERAPVAMMEGRPMSDFFSAHPQPNGNVTQGDMSALGSSASGVAQHAQQYIAQNSSPVHPQGVQSIMGPPNPSSRGPNQLMADEVTKRAQPGFKDMWGQGSPSGSPANPRHDDIFSAHNAQAQTGPARVSGEPQSDQGVLNSAGSSAGENMMDIIQGLHHFLFGGQPTPEMNRQPMPPQPGRPAPAPANTGVKPWKGSVLGHPYDFTKTQNILSKFGL